MKKQSKSVLPDSVTGFRRRLEEWRKSRTKQRSMPEALWSEATELAARHGVNPISRAFHLDFSRLKRRLEAIQTPLRTSQESRPTFVEISMEAPREAPARSPDCLVEMERPDGARIRVRISNQEDLMAVTESFWRCQS